MRLSSLADYAVVLMSAAARHCGAALLAEGKLNATKLSDETGVPLPTAKKLVSRLTAAGLIETTRGVGGGIRLARPPSSISLADIVEAVEGPIAITSCVITGNHDCKLEDGCTVKPHWGLVNRTIREALDNVSLASLSDLPRTIAQPGSRHPRENGDPGRAGTKSKEIPAFAGMPK